MEQRGNIGLDRACTTERCDSPSRRTFLLGSAIFISSSLLLGGCGGGDSTREVVAPRFLQPGEREFVRAAIDRLIPRDALGAGAVDAGVDVFIDAQLAGPFGQATGIYMQPPFHLGDTEQGYQLPFTPAQVYRLGIQRVDEHCRKTLGNVFAQLKPDQQDKILHDLEDGKIDLGEIQPGDFFGLLLQNTKEGFLADPIYGGNRDFAGWKLIGYNGPRYNYLDDVDKFGKPYDAPYVSLGGTNPVMCRFGDSPTGRFRGPGCEYAQMPAKVHYDALTTTTGKVWPAGNL
ncbi:MAG: Gluconate 2-dehydrogenase, membrane-bound, gamma subunit [Rhodanobacteraceae bacterium]|jgi:gluconate 2-dehydrogenase gamma chain|nr:MAG: Gluconate 2-dehydrogenase, membrane-bound, gamma subunit [Rhodanobacteraceae bacterium]